MEQNEMMAQALQQLKTEGLVVHKEETDSDGWGGRTTYIIAQLNRVYFKLKWDIHSKCFFKEHASGGSSPFRLEDFRIELKTQAEDNTGRVYPVVLRKGDEGAWTLDIVSTPGKWYMKTLLESPPTREKISIHGNDWYCTNFDVVMREAMQALKINSLPCEACGRHYR